MQLSDFVERKNDASIQHCTVISPPPSMSTNGVNISVCCLPLPLCDVQLVVNETPWTRGNLPEPRIPEQCPGEVWDLIKKCTDASPARRPPAKGQGPPIYHRRYMPWSVQRCRHSAGDLSCRHTCVSRLDAVHSCTELLCTLLAYSTCKRPGASQDKYLLQGVYKRLAISEVAVSNLRLVPWPGLQDGITRSFSYNSIYS